MTWGNKIRKLEFFLADAVAQGCDSVVTWGKGGTSNHCRATSLACAKIGLECHQGFKLKIFKLT